MPTTKPKTRKAAETAARGSTEAKRGVGRPSICTPEVTEAICRRIMDGESLKGICDDDAMPERSTVHAWLFDAAGLAPKPEHAEFLDRYTRARSVAMEHSSDLAAEIAKDAKADGPSGSAEVQKAKLRVDVIKWSAEKLAPKRYGAKSTTEVTGKDGGPIKTEAGVDVSRLSTETLRRVLKETAG